MNNLAIVGAVLWWAEGTKSRLDKRWQNTRSFPVELTNTNPMVIKLFAEFLKTELNIANERLRVQVQIHDGDDQDELEQFWSDITGIPLTQFQKTIVRPKGNKVGKSKGTCKIRFADKNVYKKLETLLVEVIDILPGELRKSISTLPHYEFVFSSDKIKQY
jgi:hypothetical protein